jgi:hypothetical protein
MKILLLLCLLVTSASTIAQKDYSLIIDGKPVHLNLNENNVVKIGNTDYQLMLKMNDTLTYENQLFKLKHFKELKPSKTELDKDIDQVALMNAEGAGVIVQSYYSMDPSTLNETMMNEMTKESISYGFKAKRETYQRKLASGEQVTVSRAILTYKDETNIYEVASYGKKDEGFILVTLKMDDDKETPGQKLIDLFWKTFEIKKK